MDELQRFDQSMNELQKRDAERMRLFAAVLMRHGIKATSLGLFYTYANAPHEYCLFDTPREALIAKLANETPQTKRENATC